MGIVLLIPTVLLVGFRSLCLDSHVYSGIELGMVNFPPVLLGL